MNKEKYFYYIFQHQQTCSRQTDNVGTGRFIWKEIRDKINLLVFPLTNNLIFENTFDCYVYPSWVLYPWSSIFQTRHRIWVARFKTSLVLSLYLRRIIKVIYIKDNNICGHNIDKHPAAWIIISVLVHDTTKWCKLSKIFISPHFSSVHSCTLFYHKKRCKM